MTKRKIKLRTKKEKGNLMPCFAIRSLDWYSWRLRNLRGASWGSGVASDGPHRGTAGASADKRGEGGNGEPEDEEGVRRELN